MALKATCLSTEHVCICVEGLECDLIWGVVIECLSRSVNLGDVQVDSDLWVERRKCDCLLWISLLEMDVHRSEIGPEQVLDSEG